LEVDVSSLQNPYHALSELVSPVEAPDLQGVFRFYPSVSKMASPGDLREIVASILGIPRDDEN
jgi:hypothetical protein